MLTNLSKQYTAPGNVAFGLGDRGNSVGSAGGSNYSGDGRGGQVNMNGVGMGGRNVLRQINGRWTAVDRASGQPVGGGTAAGAAVKPVQPLKALPPAPVVTPTAIQRPVVATPRPAPVANSSYFGDVSSYQGSPAPAPAPTSPFSGGRVGFAGAPKPARSPTGGRTGFSVAPAPANSTFSGGRTGFSGAGALPANTSVGGRYTGTPQRTPVTSMFAEAQRRAAANRAGAVPAGQKVTDVYGPSYAQDPSIAGRLRGPGVPAGQKVTDVFRGGPPVRMDPGIVAKMNPPSSPAAGQKVTDYFSQPMALDPSITGRVQQRPQPPTVARINPDGTLSMVKDQSRLPGMETSLGDQLSYPSEEGQIYSPAPIGSYMKYQERVPQQKQITDRLSQEQPSVTAQNYGFQAPAPSPVDQRASIVNQWRQAQMANNGAHRGLGGLPAAPQASTSYGPETPAGGEDWQQGNIDPAGWSMADIPGAESIKAGLAKGYDTFTDANQKINDYGGGKTVEAMAKLAQMFQGAGGAGKFGQGGQNNSGPRSGLKNLPKSEKQKGKGPKIVDGPTAPQPGFTWVQWSPGSPPSQIPTSALIGAA